MFRVCMILRLCNTLSEFRKRARVFRGFRIQLRTISHLVKSQPKISKISTFHTLAFDYKGFLLFDFQLVGIFLAALLLPHFRCTFGDDG